MQLANQSAVTVLSQSEESCQRAAKPSHTWRGRGSNEYDLRVSSDSSLRKHREEKHREEKHQEEKHQEEKHQEEKHQEKHWEEKHQEEKHQEEKHQEEKHQEEKHQEKHQEEKHQEKHWEEKHQEEKHQEEKHQVDKHQEEKHQEEKHQEKHQEEKHQEEKHQEKKHQEKHWEEKHQEEKHQEKHQEEKHWEEKHQEKHQEEKHWEEKHQEEKHWEEKHQEKHWEEKHQEEKHWEEKHQEKHWEEKHQEKHWEEKHQEKHWEEKHQMTVGLQRRSTEEVSRGHMMSSSFPTPYLSFAVSPPAGLCEDRSISDSVPFLFYPSGPLRGPGPGLLPYLTPFHRHGPFSVYECPLEPAFIQKRNERERQRVKCVNQGYAKLRDHLPGAGADKRLSKVETLRAAIRYIKYLQGLVQPGGRQDSGEAPPLSSPRPDCRTESQGLSS